MKKTSYWIALAIIFAGGIIAARRFSTPEDSWVCRNGAWVRHGNPSGPRPQSGCGASYDFHASGMAAKNDPGMEQDKLYLVFEQGGKAPAAIQLSFDGQSMCGDDKNLVPCMALSVYDFGLAKGRLIDVKGLRQGGAVLVREVRMGPLPPTAEAWMEIVDAVSSCRVKSVFQAHSLAVTATLKDGTEIHGIEPRIDTIMDLVAQAKPRCGDVVMATE